MIRLNVYFILHRPINVHMGKKIDEIKRSTFSILLYLYFSQYNKYHRCKQLIIIHHLSKIIFTYTRMKGITDVTNTHTVSNTKNVY